MSTPTSPATAPPTPTSPISPFTVLTKKVIFRDPIGVDIERKPKAMAAVSSSYSEGSPSATSPYKQAFSASYEESIEYPLSSSPTSPSLRRKKKKKFPMPRDSLSKRIHYQIGKPGSRRHQRFLNKAHLTDEDTDEDDYFGLVNAVIHDLPEWKSTFQELHEDASKKAIIDPFIDTDLEYEEEFLLSIEKEKKKKVEKRGGDNLDSMSKRMLMQYYGYDILTDLDSTVTLFIESINEQSDDIFATINSEHFKIECDFPNQRIMLRFNNACDRFVAHSVCRYYSLLSNSENRGNDRVTVIQMPKTLCKIPDISLQDYLAAECMRC